MSWIAPGRFISEEVARRRVGGPAAVTQGFYGKEANEVKYNIGIDLAKNKHSAAAIREGGERVLAGFGFANDGEGFASLLRKLCPSSSRCCATASPTSAWRPPSGRIRLHAASHRSMRPGLHPRRTLHHAQIPVEIMSHIQLSKCSKIL